MLKLKNSKYMPCYLFTYITWKYLVYIIYIRNCGKGLVWINSNLYGISVRKASLFLYYRWRSRSEDFMYLVSNSITRCIEICIRSFLTFFLLLEETLNHALKCFLQRIALDHSIARNIRVLFFFSRQRILKFGQNIIFFSIS